MENQGSIIKALVEEREKIKKSVESCNHGEVGVVYVMVFDEGIFKVGSTKNLKLRVKTYNSSRLHSQNVNKVETMVEGFWNIDASDFFSIEEKERIHISLKNKINSEGFLIVKSQAARTQLSNKELVLKKMKALIEKALIVKKKRKPTKATKAKKEKRIESKKINADIKKGRKKINIDE